MSKLNRTARRRSGQAALHTWGLYLLVLISWAIVCMLLAYLGALLGPKFFNWRVVSLFRAYLPLAICVSILFGWMVISYLFIARPIKQLEQLLDGASSLAHPTDTPIRLPEALKNAEDQLNLARETALRDAQLAREAEQRKNDLVVYLAHDLKTPLTSIIGYLTLLRDEPQISPELRGRYTRVAMEKAERLEELINEFFDITRFSLSHLELEKRETDLKRMLEQICSEFTPVLEQRQMQCELALEDPLRAVCDPDKMARVFDNLLSNACHYAYPDSVLHVEGWTKGGHVVLTFRNAGATIPPEKLERMFEKFFRLDAARGTQTGNAGLGLAIAKEIVYAHGGTISAQSAREQTTFTVTLPVYEPL